jgi:hypothetical protein
MNPPPTARVPDTPGSPAALVFLTLLWLIGGSMILVGLVTLPAGIRARPGEPPDFQ